MTIASSHLIPPHGGELVDLVAQPEAANELKARSREWPSWDLTARQLCDLELLLSGGFSPLPGFMTRADYEGVCHNMRLSSGLLWPMPITLDVTEDFAKTLKPGGLLLMEGYRPEQVDYRTGGPSQRENMYTRKLLEESFGDFASLDIKEYDSEVDEGVGHKGMSALIDLVARK